VYILVILTPILVILTPCKKRIIKERDGLTKLLLFS